MFKIDTGATYEQFMSTGRGTENLWGCYMEMYSVGVELWAMETYEDDTFVALKIDSQEDLLDHLNVDTPLIFEEWQKGTVMRVVGTYNINLHYERI